MKKNVLFASILISSGLLLTNIYTSLVDVKAWGNNIPASIEATRNYFTVSNPGDFFRIFSPIGQFLALLSVILFWKYGKRVRIPLFTAFIIGVLADMFTFGYFYPRNEIMFIQTPLPSTEILQQTWSEWNSMNWLRSLVVLAGIVFSFISLDRIYKTNSQ